MASSSSMTSRASLRTAQYGIGLDGCSESCRTGLASRRRNPTARATHGGDDATRRNPIASASA
jgi:hypothetical protein